MSTNERFSSTNNNLKWYNKICCQLINLCKVNPDCTSIKYCMLESIFMFRFISVLWALYCLQIQLTAKGVHFWGMQQWQYCLYGFLCSWVLWRTCDSVEIPAFVVDARGGASIPKCINTITSSRWLEHLVSLFVIVLMLYWLLLSREQKRACNTVDSFHKCSQTHTHTLVPASHCHRLALTTKNSQSISQGVLGWLSWVDWTCRLFTPTEIMARRARKGDQKCT